MREPSIVNYEGDFNTPVGASLNVGGAIREIFKWAEHIQTGSPDVA
jgi:hypothetical protein